MYNFKTVSDAYLEARKYNSGRGIAPFPPYVTIELLNRCNFRCRMCALTYQDKTEVQFPLDELKKLIDRIAEYGSLVRFIGFCEPLMYKHFREAAAYVKQKGLMLHLTTNASLLDRSMSDFLVDIGLDSIIFSFQGGSKEEYMSMRSLSGAAYDKVRGNIAYLHSVRKKTSMKLTTTITERDTKESIAGFIKDHSAHTDEVQVSGLTHFVHISDHFGEEDIWTELGIERPELKSGARCSLPDFELLIKADGSVNACCGAYTDSLEYGNVFEDDIMDIWQGERAENIRRRVAEEMETIENCRVCPLRYRYADIDNAVYNTRK